VAVDPKAIETAQIHAAHRLVFAIVTVSLSNFGCSGRHSRVDLGDKKSGRKIIIGGAALPHIGRQHRYFANSLRQG